MGIVNEVGVTAGQIWKLLESGGPQTPTQLRKKLDAKANLIDFALGWLAREDKIEIVQEKRTLRVSLK